MPKTALEYAEEAQAIFRNADLEGRETTPEEAGRIEALLARSKRARRGEKANDGARAVSNALGNAEPVTVGGASYGDPGRRFIESEGYKRIANPLSRREQFSTGKIDISGKGTLLSGPGSPGSGTGGGLLPVPQVQEGIVDRLLVGQLGVVDILGSGVATGNTVRYINEGTATSAAAGVDEGGLKPESTLGLSTVDEPVRKVATSIVTSDELVDDAAATADYVSSRLTYFLRIEEERQLLRGSGGSEIPGIVGRSGVNTYGIGADNNVVGLAKVIANTRGSSFVEPDAIVMSPVNWTASRLLRDGAGGTVGQFYGGGPFTGAYGAGGATGLWGQQLWNKPVILSDHIGAGTALVGNFGSAARRYLRGGPTAEMTNSHSDHFVRDLVALRAEIREALAVFRPNAFTVVTGLSS